MTLRAFSGFSRSQTGGLLHPGYRSGTRIGLPIPLTALSTSTAVVANVMYAWPIPIARNVPISGVSLQVGTAVPGVSGKLGLALPGSNGFPETLLAEAPTPVDMNSTASTELVAALSAAVSVSQFVWALCVFNGAAIPLTVPGFNAAGGTVGHYMGATSISDYTGPGSGQTTRMSRAHTYASAFPATLTGWATAIGTPSSPIQALVVA